MTSTIVLYYKEKSVCGAVNAQESHNSNTQKGQFYPSYEGVLPELKVEDY